MQNVWLAPVPGLFLGVVWIVDRPGSVFFFNWDEERAAAFERFVFVIDPGSDQLAVRSIRARLDELGRAARTWIRRCRIANALFWLSLLLAVWWWVDRSGDAARDPLMEVAVPAMLVCAAVALLFVIPCDRRTRDVVRQIHQFEAPGALGSAGLGADKLVVRLIARAAKSSACEQRLLAEHLWRIAVAERARDKYLHSGKEFEEAEFSVLRRRLEDAQRDLKAWAGSLPPL